MKHYGCACLHLDYLCVQGQISSALSDCKGRQTAQAIALHVQESARCSHISFKMKKGEPRYCFSAQPKGITNTSKSVRYRLAFLVFPEIHLKSYSVIHERISPTSTEITDETLKQHNPWFLLAFAIHKFSEVAEGPMYYSFYGHILHPHPYIFYIYCKRKAIQQGINDGETVEKMVGRGLA